MASACCFAKPFSIGVPLRFLSCAVRQKCILKTNPGISIFRRSMYLKVQKMLKDILTYNRSSTRMKESFFHPVSFTPFSSSSFLKNYNHQQQQSPIIHTTIRSYCSNNRPPGIPPLIEVSDLPLIHLPNPFKSIRSWLLIHFIIRQNLDKEFVPEEFSKFSTKAVQVVSARLSQTDYDSLEGLLTDELLGKIKDKLNNLSLAQRQELIFDLEDVIFQFLYDIGLEFDVVKNSSKGTSQKKGIVKITMCYQISGDSEMLSKVSGQPFNDASIDIKAAAEKIYLLNCRFIREYVEGVEDQWTIDGFNFCRLADFWRQMENRGKAS